MNSKNIAVIVGVFPAISQTFIVNQVNSLIESGINVSLFAYKRGDDFKIHESLNKHALLNKVIFYKKAPKLKISRLFSLIIWTFQNCKIIKWNLFFKVLNVFKYGKDAYTLKLFYESQWFLVPYDFDLIHAHFGMNGNRIAYLKAYGIIPKHIKLVTTFHGFDLAPEKLKDYGEEYKYLFKEASAFTVNTPYLEGLLQQVNSHQKPNNILPVGLDTTFFKKQITKKKIPYFDIVFCGRLIPLKGPDLTIDILKKLHELGYLNVRLHLVGEGKLRNLLKKQVQSNNLQDYVVFYGALSQEKIIKCFEQADVFLLPGRYDPETGRAETQGLVIQEAQAMELPVIISDVGGMKYGLLPNESGFVIAEENLDAFVDAIEQLIMNPKLKLKMGRAGRLFVKSKYENSVLVKKLIEIYSLKF